jgi:hypothetical protein
MRRVDGSEPAVVLIGGEAGVGKIRLVGELAALGSAAGLWVLTGQCIELGAAGLPLPRGTQSEDLVAGAIGQIEVPRPDRRRATADAWAARGGIGRRDRSRTGRGRRR